MARPKGSKLLTLGKIPRVTSRITGEALDRLNAEVERRTAIEPRVCTQGTVMTELIMEYLPPAPETEPEPAPEPMPVKPVAVKRGPGRPRKIRDEAKTA